MIAYNNHTWEVLDDVIKLGDKTVVAVYAGSRKVYPIDDERLRYAMWFNFDYIISSHGSIPVNQYGVYLSYADDEHPIHRVACYLDITQTPYKRMMFVSLYRYAQKRGSSDLLYVPYLASNGKIIYDGFNPGESVINMFTLNEYQDTSSGFIRYYYHNRDPVSVNLTDSQGRYILDYSKTQSSENCKVFYTQQECIAYVLG